MGELMRIGEITNTTAISIPTGDGGIGMSVADVMKWVAPGAPPHEALKFLMVCRAAKVNPFLKEAHLVPMGSKWETIIDKSGWLRQAEEHPQYDGFDAGIILRKITGKAKGPNGEILKGADGKPILEYGDLEDHDGAVQPSGYQLVGGWARVYRKDRKRPTVARVSLTEYRKDTPNWKGMPCTMIRKVALVQALREARFLVGGAYDRDEMPGLDDEAFTVASESAAQHTREVRDAIDVEFAVAPTHQLDISLARQIESLIRDVDMSDYHRDLMLGRRGVRSIVELSQHDARDIITKLTHKRDEIRAGEILLPDPQPAAAGDGGSEVIEAEVITPDPDDAETAIRPDAAIDPDPALTEAESFAIPAARRP